MLKALELVGFKSFADKTRFEFLAGITVIVGPNGSGKSNVVDAIKWVLGAQSAKSLRGGQMADVIFKGSGSGTRRPANTAEITLTLVNVDGFLPIDSPEVHITRRVYRSGEGEYLINRQPCRLRDIRDLFSGTGVATDAYSVIEQGKVDALLKASPRERRIIFEEAAGISRFKAKKVEAMRRMERVEQNLLRLSDIVEEVDSRLRTIKLQANKAARYKEYTERLQSLRTQVGMADWRRLSEQLDLFEQELETLRAEADGINAQVEAEETTQHRIDAEIVEADTAAGGAEARLAAIREQIASCEATIAHERRRTADVEEEIARGRQQSAALGVRAGDLAQQLAETLADVNLARQDHHELRARAEHSQQELAERSDEVQQLRQRLQQRRDAHVSQVRGVTTLANKATSLEQELADAEAVYAQQQQLLNQLDSERVQLQQQEQSLQLEHQRLAADVEDRGDEREGAESLLAERRRQLAIRQAQLGQIQRRHSAAAERAAVLEELERRQEGIGSGVREILAQARAASEGPLAEIRGLVADRFQVNVETAGLIDVALGERAQHLIVSGDAALAALLEDRAGKLSGRVGFVPQEAGHSAATHAPSAVDLGDEPGVLGRADSFVQTEPAFANLARHLLGGTWIVQDLPRALELLRSQGRGGRFVTLAGELVEPDGTVVVGPRHTTAALVSRRSELRVLREQIAELASRITAQEAAVAELEQRITDDEQRLKSLSLGYQRAYDAMSEQRIALGQARQQLAQFDRRRQGHLDQRDAADAQRTSAGQALLQTQSQLAEDELQLAELEALVEADNQQLQVAESQRQACAEQENALRVELARAEQRLDHLRVRLTQFERDQQERQRAVDANAQALVANGRRLVESQGTILGIESQLATSYLEKESLAGQIGRIRNGRQALQEQRTEAARNVQRLRGQLRKVEEKIHATELRWGEVRHERTTLADRMREDYDIDLAEVARLPIDEEQLHEREQIEQEIADLRRKINSMGSVNMEALHELDELEERNTALAAQFQDLTAAKDALGQIIQRINADSRRLFVETLEAVRENFEKLFRRAFGGGKAELVLEEGLDVLDAGVEIVATPPGKSQLSTSLLSGGERALTAITLLLAIFRFRPSPFCVLDEVDAPLDEANIDRFIRLLREFPTSTQFIVVSHSKKTMTAAETLYGVTMQESGVSKRVAVRFENDAATGEVNAVFSPGEESSDAGDEDETQAA